MLHTEPSFSVYADEGGLINIEKGDLKISESSDEFSFAKNLGIVGEEEEEDENIEAVGINGVEVKHTSFDGTDYKKMLDEDPANPLILKNYAHLLQSNGDLNAAEEYYFRATQADPKDGETLMQYAKLVWELHHDQDRASSYFEAAVLAAPKNPYIHAAYASFLWEIDDDDDTREASRAQEFLEVDENCCEPLLLRNHARFLRQTKGDLRGAEEYYIRALQTDPLNGELASECAQLVWELHHDQEKASGYFEQAVQAAPADSHILAAYAKFLWEAEDEDQLPKEL